MKILLVNKYHYPKGGADRYYLDLGARLEQRGYAVAYFAMQHEKNISTPWERYFCDTVLYKSSSLTERIAALFKIFYNRDARKKFAKLCDDFAPDIIHVHNIYHQLSPAILFEAKKRNIPVIMHLHDYKILSPQYMLFAHGRAYERCIGGKYYRCFFDKAFKDSYFLSFIVMCEMYLHHSIFHVYKKTVHTFIAPSQYMHNMIGEYRADLYKKTILIPYGINTEIYAPVETPSDEYFLYYGRLEKEKGIDLLIKGYASLTNKKKTLLIVGDGSYKKELKKIVADNGLSEKVIFFDFCEGKSLQTLVQNAYAVLVPSQWPELFGMTSIEAMACERAVIATRTGELAHTIEHKKNGWLCDTQSSEEIANALNYFQKNPEEVAAWGRSGRKKVLNHYDQTVNHIHIKKLYEEVFKK